LVYFFHCGIFGPRKIRQPWCGVAKEKASATLRFKANHLKKNFGWRLHCTFNTFLNTRGGSGLSPSPKVGLGPFIRQGPKPNFFIYLVKPASDLSPTYFVNFSSFT
jgi:hypothetical protein